MICGLPKSEESLTTTEGGGKENLEWEQGLPAAGRAM